MHRSDAAAIIGLALRSACSSDGRPSVSTRAWILVVSHACASAPCTTLERSPDAVRSRGVLTTKIHALFDVDVLPIADARRAEGRVDHRCSVASMHRRPTRASSKMRS